MEASKPVILPGGHCRGTLVSLVLLRALSIAETLHASQRRSAAMAFFRRRSLTFLVLFTSPPVGFRARAEVPLTYRLRQAAVILILGRRLLRPARTSTSASCSWALAVIRSRLPVAMIRILTSSMICPCRDQRW